MGEGFTSLKLRDRGASVRSFGLENGWDFFRQTDRDAFKRFLLAEEPGELWTSPTCGPWPQLQELNRLIPESADRLVQLRRWRCDVILKFTADVYEIQRKAGRHAQFEHPKTARTWRARNVQRMKGYVRHGVRSVCLRPQLAGHGRLLQEAYLHAHDEGGDA